MFEQLTSIEFSLTKTVLALLAVALLASWDLTQRIKHRNAHYLFACILGTLLSVGFILFPRTLLSSTGLDNGFALGFGIVLLILAWRLLFGPWEAETKATILGAFVFWIALHMLWKENDAQRFSHLIAIGIALVTAVISCMLFRSYQ